MESGADVTLPKYVHTWPDLWRELWQERAGIMEFDGKISRPEAEKAAEKDIRKVAEKI